MNKIESKVIPSLNVKELRSGRRLKADENNNPVKSSSDEIAQQSLKEARIDAGQGIHLPLRDSGNLAASDAN